MKVSLTQNGVIQVRLTSETDIEKAFVDAIVNATKKGVTITASEPIHGPATAPPEDPQKQASEVILSIPVGNYRRTPENAD